MAYANYSATADRGQVVRLGQQSCGQRPFIQKSRSTAASNPMNECWRLNPAVHVKECNQSTTRKPPLTEAKLAQVPGPFVNYINRVVVCNFRDSNAAPPRSALTPNQNHRFMISMGYGFVFHEHRLKLRTPPSLSRRYWRQTRCQHAWQPPP